MNAVTVSRGRVVVHGVPVDHRAVAADGAGALPRGDLRAYLVDGLAGHRGQRFGGEGGVALEEFQDLPHGE